VISKPETRDPKRLQEPQGVRQEERRFWGLLRRRQCLVPTWRGWLALALGLSLGVLGIGRNLYRFLAVTKPVPGGLLVIEGWAPDYAMEAAIVEFKAHRYDRLMVIGGPLDNGAPLSEYRTFAEMGAAVLVRLGMSTNVVQAVPAPLVRQDRTFAAGAALRDWLRIHGTVPAKVNLISVGPHARRSRMMLQKVFGKQVAVGIVSLPSREFDPAHWWRSSAGFRSVIDETIAYAYARVLFRPPETSESGAPPAL
jgi:hypothetical protein